MKKVLSVLLSLCMLFSIMAGLDFSAIAGSEDYDKYFDYIIDYDDDGEYDDEDDEDYTTGNSGDYTYRVCKDGTASIVKYNGSSRYITLPSTLAGYTVSSIDDQAFEFCNLISVTIPETIVSLDKTAFLNSNVSIIEVNSDNPVYSSENGVVYNKNKTELVYFPEDKGIEHTMLSTVNKIGDYAFAGSKISVITFNSKINTIGDYAFDGCYKLENLEIPETVLLIGEGAFANCYNLKSIAIKGLIYEIKRDTFAHCNSLSNISLPDTILRIHNDVFKDTRYYLNDDNWEDGLLYIGNYWIAKQRSFTGNYKVKEGTRIIPDKAFYECRDLESVSIPDSVVNIGFEAFANCGSLKKVEISENSILQFLGAKAFTNCYSLQSIHIPYRVSQIEFQTFLSCGRLTSVTGCANLKYIGEDAFYSCRQLANITLSSSRLEELGEMAFNGCESLTSISLPSTLKKIGDYCFIACDKLKSINVSSNNYKSINGVLYTADGKILLTYPCSKPGATFTTPSSVTGIAKSAFDNCRNVERIILGKNVSRIGVRAFYNNWCLYSIQVLNPNCTFYSEADTIYGSEVSICGYKNSTTQNYCKKYNKNFVCLNDYNCDSGKHCYDLNYRTAATLTENGSENYTCQICGDKNKNAIYYPKSVALSTTSYTYDGEAKKPSVTVKDSNGKTIASNNYTVTYASGRKKVGKYKVTIKFKGNYTGTKDLYFTIKPKNTSVSKLTAKSKGFKIKWKKQTTQTTGYQIQYATNSKFTKNAKTITVSKNSTTSKTVTKLKGKKKYYVRIRTYKTVNGAKYYSAWSKAKTVTTKK